MGNNMSDVWACWSFPNFHQLSPLSSSFSVSPYKLEFVILSSLGNSGYREQDYVKHTPPFIKKLIFSFCPKEISVGCDLYLCTATERGKPSLSKHLLAERWGKRNRVYTGCLQRFFSKKSMHWKVFDEAASFHSQHNNLPLNYRLEGDYCTSFSKVTIKYC